MTRNKKGPGANRASGRDVVNRKAGLTTAPIVPHEPIDGQHLSILLDLATWEVEQLAEKVNRHQRLADCYRRRLWAKMENYYHLQRLIPPAGGQP